MAFRRPFLTMIAAVVLQATALPRVHAQDADAQDVLKLKKPEMAQYEALNTLVDAVMTGKEPAPADVKLKFQYHFVKSATNVFVPYVIDISGGKFTSFPVALYVRAVSKGGTVGAADKKGSHAFTDIYFLQDARRLQSTGNDSVEFSRGLELPVGECDLYVAMTETQPRNGKTRARRVVHTVAVTVPDFSTALTTSSVILAKAMNEAPQQLTAQQQLDEPFTIGGFKISPSFTQTFSKSGELLFTFFIYNPGAATNDKPDVEVGYLFSRAAESKPFSKAPTTVFNATTLPPEFSLSAGHQLVVGQGIPLASFAPGGYKLQVTIRDKAANQTIVRDVPFTVTE